ncbi:hypothetical protein ElyMa_004784500 [Elysia marginata]|uniref:Uncharacterized protein n=1 Tax=Elysia marginata TaxID=1093978 RepID=A0AAV4IGY5_9GAST|nr:hypothetical protein ElyMa_004784500 [Elysia marginata]
MSSVQADERRYGGSSSQSQSNERDGSVPLRVRKGLARTLISLIYLSAPSTQGSGCVPRQVLRTRIQTASWMGKMHEKKGDPASWLRAGPGDENIKQSQIFLLWPPASPAGAKKL